MRVIPVLLVTLLAITPAFAQHPYDLNPYKPSDAVWLRNYGATLVSLTPLAELRKLDPYIPSQAALLRQLGGAMPLWVGWYLPFSPVPIPTPLTPFPSTEAPQTPVPSSKAVIPTRSRVFVIIRPPNNRPSAPAPPQNRPQTPDQLQGPELTPEPPEEQEPRRDIIIYVRPATPARSQQDVVTTGRF